MKFEKKLVEMVGKITENPQLDMFRIPLKQFINESHELVVLSKKIDWDNLERSLEIYSCADNGRPGIPIPLIKFRQRIGERGAEQILKLSVNLFSEKEIKESEVLIDTTVQEKNITFPTDVKLQKKIIEKCRKISKREGIQLRQVYKRELKQLMIDQRFHSHPKRRKKALAAARRIKVIAAKILRDLERKMDTGQKSRFEKQLKLFKQVLSQKRSSKNKGYSLHQPHVGCIAKGKEHKKYEFGNKSSIVKTRKSGIIVGAMAFTGNPYDGDTLEPQLLQTERITANIPEMGIVDRGYRGRKAINGTKIVCPHNLPENAGRYQRQKIRKWFRSRAGIEPVIGHVKHDHRMDRNYLLDELGDSMNTILAAVGFNLRKMLRRLKTGAKNIFEIIWEYISRIIINPEFISN